MPRTTQADLSNVILIAEDSKLQRKTLCTVLGKMGYKVIEAVDGEDALAKFRQHNPEIIITDLHMPRMDGFALIKAVREIEKRYVYITVISGIEDKESVVLALTSGANDYLVKPYHPEELKVRLNAARLNQQVRRAYELIAQEIEMVASLQRQLLPDDDQKVDWAHLESFYKPSGQASGDYFDYFQIGENTLRVIMADVSGHGARAAFIMAIVRTYFRLTQNTQTNLAETLRQINSQLCRIIGEESDFVSVFAADMNYAERSIEYVNAGHCPALLTIDEVNTLRLDAGFPVLGFFELDFVPGKYTYSDKMNLFLYTDGFYEWEVEPGKILGMDEFWNIIAQLSQEKKFFLDPLMNEFKAIAGHEPAFTDDLAALWLEIT